MKVRLIRKLADCLNGVDVAGHDVGDVFDLPLREAGLLIAEGWAEVTLSDRSTASAADPRDETRPPTPRDPAEDRLDPQRLGDDLVDLGVRRRAEDRFREEHHDAHAKIVEPDTSATLVTDDVRTDTPREQ
jgi:hypothetical protein